MDLRPRTLLQRLTDAVTPDEAAEPDEDQAQPEPEPAPAEPESAPTVPVAAAVPAQPAPLRPGDRAPAWWEPKPVIAGPVCTHPNPSTFQLGETGEQVPFWCPDCKEELYPDVPAASPAPAPATARKGSCEHPNPHAVRSQPTGQLVAYWCADCETQLPVPDDYDELEDVKDADVEQDGDGGEVPAAIRRRWSVRGSGEKTYARPGYLKSKPAPKQSLVDWWISRSSQSRWLLYNGTALAGGFALGVPQFFTAEVAYLVHTYHSWMAFYVVIWYGVAIGVWAWDHKTRRWLPPFALAARIPMVSMVVGSLLYGTPHLPV
ncbi:hypothetical protein VSR01_17340 [Actinacidiphila sp. DG2A-62]|uniref:hypothetical protein n=1 Tax=Actinacidiphila sp. DG2A-62 TaxID=3108821 RepID=UPI002DB7AB22|nr:hypothetical protein [Actinacidiphila sp. DG2A-62]MEC3995203.1 hypothetical protein [Actinacidiphila sp. DG2A-62]